MNIGAIVSVYFVIGFALWTYLYLDLESPRAAFATSLFWPVALLIYIALGIRDAWRGVRR